MLTVPEIAPKLHQGLTGFFLQLSIPFPDIFSTAIINETIVEPSRPGIVSVVLDIDIFRTSALPTEDEQLWKFFDVLRTRKNDIFEACITDKTRELFR